MDGDRLQLPGLLAEIAEVAGVGAALAIAEVKGGASAYIPAPPVRAEHWLVLACGQAAADAIAGHFAVRGGAHYKIPLGPVASRYRLWRKMHQMIDRDIPAAEIARRLGIDERTVRRHRKGESGQAAADDRQAALF